MMPAVATQPLCLLMWQYVAKLCDVFICTLCLCPCLSTGNVFCRRDRAAMPMPRGSVRAGPHNVGGNCCAFQSEAGWETCGCTGLRFPFAVEGCWLRLKCVALVGPCCKPLNCAILHVYIYIFIYIYLFTFIYHISV